MHDAFISYSHAADVDLAPRLEAALQRFAKPWYRIRALHVFRDATNLNLSPHLWDTIAAALRDAAHFVYLASPEAAASKWVAKELDFWLTNKDRQKLLIVVTGGEIAWDERTNDFDWTVTTSVPRVLSGAFAGEPLYLDLRWARQERDLSLQNPRFKEAVALLSATIHGRSVEDMIGEEVVQHRRTRRLRNAAIATLSVLFVAAAAAAVVAVRQRAEALRQRDRAVATGLLNRVRSELESGSLGEAVRIARASHRVFGAGPIVLETISTVATHPTAVVATFREPVGSRPRVAFSPDGRHILSLFENSSGSFAARIRDWRGRELRSHGQVYLAEYSPDGSHLIVGRPWALYGAVEEDGSWCDNGVPAPPVTDYAVVGLQSLDLSRPESEGVDLPMGLRAIAPDGTLRAAVCGNYVHLDSAAGTRVGSLRVPGVVDARFSPDGRRLLVATARRTSIYDVSRPSGIAEAKLADLEGGAPAVSPDGAAIATVAGSRSIVWDASWREIARRPGRGPVFGPGGLLVTVEGDGSLLWRPDAKDAVRYPGVSPGISPDGLWIMTTVEGTRTRIADLDGRELTTLDGVSGRFSSRAPVVMTATAAGVIRLWDLRRVGVVSPPAAARLWPIDAGDLRPLERADGPAACLLECVSHDGSIRASVMMMGVTPGAPMSAKLRLEAAAGGAGSVTWQERPAGELEGCLGPVAPLVFSPAAGHDLVVGCGDGTLAVYDRGGAVRWKKKHGGQVTRVVVSADGALVLSASADRSARLWNLATGDELSALTGHESEVVLAAFAPNGDAVMTLTGRGVLRLWNRTPALTATVSVPDDALMDAVFVGDGTVVVGRTQTGRYRRWIVDVERQLGEFSWVDEVSDEEARDLGLP
jgi:WD40 repeat protein